MKRETKIKGLILGMEQMGAKFIHQEGENIYFKIIIGSEMDNAEKLERSRIAFSNFGIRLFIRKVEK